MHGNLQVLYVATSDAHLKLFHRPHLRWLEKHGFTVDICAEKRWNCDLPAYRNFVNVPFPRKAIGLRHLTTWFALISLLRKTKYDIIHCHTPVAAMLIRLAHLVAGKRSTRVVYTVHGFHFYPGAPAYFWAIYYPVEWLLSWITDDLITINKTEFEFAKRKMHYKRVHYMPGMGIDPEKLAQSRELTKLEARAKYGYAPDDFVLLYSAEFIPRKDHLFLIRALAELVDKIPSIRLILAGQGRMRSELEKEIARLKIGDKVDFIGYVDSIGQYLRLVDVAVSTALNEGFGMGVAEASAMGVPVVVTNTNGHRDIVKSGANGFLFDLGDQRGFQDAILQLYAQPELGMEMGEKGRAAGAVFSLEQSLKSLETFYLEPIENNGKIKSKRDGILVF